jgi:hypothetical protein
MQVENQQLQSRRNRVLTVLNLDRIIAISLIAISIFLFPSLVGAQTAPIQPIKVWTDKSAYSLGDSVTIFWDKNGPCISVQGASGTVDAYGGNIPSAPTALTQSQLQAGSLNEGSFDAARDAGNWTVVLDVRALNCYAHGTTAFTVVGGRLEYLLRYVVPLVAVVVLVAVLGGALVLRHRRQN